jgi:hypothetical protein
MAGEPGLAAKAADAVYSNSRAASPPKLLRQEPARPDGCRGPQLRRLAHGLRGLGSGPDCAILGWGSTCRPAAFDGVLGIDVLSSPWDGKKAAIQRIGWNHSRPRLG